MTNENKKNRQNIGNPSGQNNPQDNDYRSNQGLGRNDNRNNPSGGQSGMGSSDNR